MFELRPYSKSGGHIAYNPFREMEEFEKRFFGSPFGSFFRDGNISEFKTDITDEGDSFVLEADLPGFDKKDIHLDVSDNTLTVSAERRSEHEEKDKQSKYVHMERAYGRYSRSFDVSSIDTNGIKAKYGDGVLRLVLPKKQETQPETRRLDIE